jgi:hypothetical protein
MLHMPPTSANKGSVLKLAKPGSGLMEEIWWTEEFCMVGFVDLDANNVRLENESIQLLVDDSVVKVSRYAAGNHDINALFDQKIVLSVTKSVNNLLRLL